LFSAKTAIPNFAKLTADVLGDSIVDSLNFTTTKTETFGDAEEVAASASLPIEEFLIMSGG